MGIATLLAIGMGCGGFMLFQAFNKRPTKALRLPPLWAMVGGFALALATGIGLSRVESLVPLLGPWFVLTAAALPPLAAVAWIVDHRPGWLTRRRAGVAFSVGATGSVLLAIFLEIVAPLAFVWLLLDLGDPLLDAFERLLNLLAGGEVARALTSPGFFIALFQLAIVAPLVEEFAKSLAVVPLLRGFLPDAGGASRRNVFLLGAAAGAGFAAVENAIYALFSARYWSGVLLVRALGAAVHPLGAGLAALAWHAWLHRKSGIDRRWLWGFPLAAGQHALWNGGIVLWITLSGTAFFGTAPQETDVMGVTIAAGLLALLALEGMGLWIVAREVSRRLDPAWTTSEEGGDHVAIQTPSLSTERAVALWAVVCLVVLLPVGLAALRIFWVGGR